MSSCRGNEIGSSRRKTAGEHLAEVERWASAALRRGVESGLMDVPAAWTSAVPCQSMASDSPLTRHTSWSTRDYRKRQPHWRTVDDIPLVRDGRDGGDDDHARIFGPAQQGHEPGREKIHAVDVNCGSDARPSERRQSPGAGGAVGLREVKQLAKPTSVGRVPVVTSVSFGGLQERWTLLTRRPPPIPASRPHQLSLSFTKVRR